jgi:acyl-CoA thioesterase-2
MRVPEQLGAAWPAHFAGLAYLSDSTLIDHVVLPHGHRWQDPALNGASLDHAMWFHHRARADEWLLFDQHVEATGHGRGFARGRFFDRGGRLVASCAQEGMIRWS